MNDEEKVKQDVNVAFARLRQLERAVSLSTVLKFIVLAGAAAGVLVAAARAVTTVATTPYQLEALWRADTARQQAQARRDLEQDIRTDSLLEELIAMRLQVQAGVAILCVKATRDERRLARVQCAPADLGR